MQCGVAYADDDWTKIAGGSIVSSVPALADFKKALFDYGYNFQINYTGETFGNPTGGVKQGAIYEGLLEMAVDGDLEKIAGLKGGTFHVNAYQIHGEGLSTNNIDNFMTVSSIEARHSTRLFELWYEQQLFDNKASIRIGQMSADAEFFVSDLGALFLNATFGLPNKFAADLPSGGPAYPLATPAVRLKVTPTDALTFLLAAFNGDPSGAGFNGLQEIEDLSGINFRLRDPPLVLGEAQFRYYQDKDSQGLAGTFKLGAWYHFGDFDDLRFGTDHLSLANPASNHAPVVYSGDYSLHAGIDQMVWRSSKADPTKGIGVFSRVSISPTVRNLVNFYAEAGVTFNGLWDARPDDVFGVGVTYLGISPEATALDMDANFFAGSAMPVRDFESVIELTYQAHIAPGWNIQPDFQYIFRPGAGAVNPANPAAGRIPDAAVFGLRTTFKF